MKLIAACKSQTQPGVISYQNIEKKSGVASWQALLDQWRLHFENVASRFLAGENPVAPVQDSVCSRCGMQSLCRIEAGAADAGGEEDGS